MRPPDRQGWAGFRRAAWLVLVACTLHESPAAAKVPAPGDPLFATIQRIDAYLHRNEEQGVTRDPRSLQNPAEEIRLTVVPQLLAYYELHRAYPNLTFYRDIVARADFLVEHFDDITSGTAFDGMLGYGLLAAYEVTRDPRYFAKGEEIVRRCLVLRGFQITLNWGLMSGMALAKYYALTGNPTVRAKLDEILALLEVYQHGDGSFPHYCGFSSDIHYTAWMAMELVIIGKDCDLGPGHHYLERIEGFLEDRVGEDGLTSYEGPCPGYLGCRTFFFSRASGCPEDYDTRGWINELGYHAVVFDHFRRHRYHAVIGRICDLEENGTFADKWDYFPDSTDPIYPWASGDPSVIRTSVTFWALASIFSARPSAAPATYRAPDAGAPASPFVWCAAPIGAFWGPADVAAFDTTAISPTAPPPMDRVRGGDVDTEPPMGRGFVSPGESPAVGLRIGPVTPSPMQGSAEIRFAHDRDAATLLTVYDVRGRLVRTLVASRMPAGEHRVAWDRHDEMGQRAATGIYYLRLLANGRLRIARIIALP